MKLQRMIILLLMCCVILSIAGVANAKSAKIPITTSSEKAREYYLAGRDLAEKLRGTEARGYFRKAVAEDPEFALAYLNLSLVAVTNKEFFEYFDKAVSLMSKVSDGEKLIIMAIQAGVELNTIKQREFYKKLVAAYPEDERAHNLLGNNYFGTQDYAAAIERYNRALRLNPDFSQPYNQLGYSYRFVGNYTDAEKAFKKYIKLIPDDPNPYDSYAELLMQIGKFNESIKYYRKALNINPLFLPSHIGIATDYAFLGQHTKAREQLQTLYDHAVDVGQRRGAYFATAVSYVDEGNYDAAIAVLQKSYGLAAEHDDPAGMAGDVNNMGNILVEAGKYDQALIKYQKAVDIIEASGLAEEVKENARRAYLYNSAKVAMHQADYLEAKAKADAYRKQVGAVGSPFLIRFSHELDGMIALAEKDYATALAELPYANQQNPYNLYRMALAYQAKGNTEKAREFCERAAHANSLNNLNYAFIRAKAEKMLAGM